MKKVLLLIFTLLAVCFPSFSIGFGYHIFEARSNPDFSNGVFPSSLKYQFNFPVPDFLEGSATLLTFRLDNGLVYRTLSQDPESGEAYKKEQDFPQVYSTHYDEFNLLFSQGFVPTSFSDSDLISLYMSIDGRFEMNFERLSWMRDESEREGVFYRYDSEEKKHVPRFESYNGVPELKGNRSPVMMSLSFGLKLSYMRDEVTRRDGIELDALFRYAPSALQIFGKSMDYAYLALNFEASWTALDVRFEDGKQKSSLILFDRARYVYISGKSVPNYIRDYSISSMFAFDLAEHSIINRLGLKINAAALLSSDTYMSFSLYFDTKYSRGRMMNSSESIEDLAYGIGTRLEYRLYDIAAFYAEIDYKINPSFDESSKFSYSYGFTLGI